jgi:hypothetical protein
MARVLKDAKTANSDGRLVWARQHRPKRAAAAAAREKPRG